MLCAFARRVASSAPPLREQPPICPLQIERAFLGSQSHKADRSKISRQEKNPIFLECLNAKVIEKILSSKLAETNERLSFRTLEMLSKLPKSGQVLRFAELIQK